jgi:hypothetical protein
MENNSKAGWAIVNALTDSTIGNEEETPHFGTFLAHFVSCSTTTIHRFIKNRTNSSKRIKSCKKKKVRGAK